MELKPGFVAALALAAVALAVLAVLASAPGPVYRFLHERTDDDQPITMAGGSFFLGNDPGADWEVSDTTLVYQPRTTNADVDAVTIEANGTRTDLTRTGALTVAVTLKAGAGPMAQTHVFTLTTDGGGKNVVLTPPNEFARKYRRPLWNLRFWKMAAFEIKRISVAGTNPTFNREVDNGDASVLVRFQ